MLSHQNFLHRKLHLNNQGYKPPVSFIIIAIQSTYPYTNGLQTCSLCYNKNAAFSERCEKNVYSTSQRVPYAEEHCPRFIFLFWGGVCFLLPFNIFVECLYLCVLCLYSTLMCLVYPFCILILSC
jgi:hypothetical protein